MKSPDTIVPAKSAIALLEQPSSDIVPVSAQEIQHRLGWDKPDAEPRYQRVVRHCTSSAFVLGAPIGVGVLLGTCCRTKSWGMNACARLPRGRVLRACAKCMRSARYGRMPETETLSSAHVWARRNPIFHVCQVSSIGASNTALGAGVKDGHADAANLALMQADLHAAASLLHRHLLNDDMLDSMLPALGRQ